MQKEGPSVSQLLLGAYQGESEISQVRIDFYTYTARFGDGSTCIIVIRVPSNARIESLIEALFGRTRYFLLPYRAAWFWKNREARLAYWIHIRFPYLNNG